MSLPNGLPSAREIPFEDWEFFYGMYLFKLELQKKFKTKMSIAKAAFVFLTSEFAEEEGMSGVILFNDEKPV